MIESPTDLVVINEKSKFELDLLVRFPQIDEGTSLIALGDIITKLIGEPYHFTQIPDFSSNSITIRIYSKEMRAAVPTKEKIIEILSNNDLLTLPDGSEES